MRTLPLIFSAVLIFAGLGCTSGAPTSPNTIDAALTEASALPEAPTQELSRGSQGDPDPCSFDLPVTDTWFGSSKASSKSSPGFVQLNLCERTSGRIKLADVAIGRSFSTDIAEESPNQWAGKWIVESTSRAGSISESGFVRFSIVPLGSKPSLSGIAQITTVTTVIAPNGKPEVRTAIDNLRFATTSR